MSNQDSVADDRVDPRAERSCLVCGGTLIEPRSGDKWNCVDCARRFDEEDTKL